MKIAFIIIIILGAIAIFEGSVYRTLTNPMGFHPTRGTAIIVIGIVFVIVGAAGLIIRSRKQST